MISETHDEEQGSKYTLCDKDDVGSASEMQNLSGGGQIVDRVQNVKMSSATTSKGAVPPNEGQESRSSSGDTTTRSSSAPCSESVTNFIEKCKGVGAKPPPPAPFSQSTIAFIGSFITLFILSALSRYIESATQDRYNIALGPFGALLTLQYSLTGAPPAQPRNAIYGVLVSLPIAICLSYVPDFILAHWVRVALAPSLAIGAMAKLGIQHPPAGAAAVLFSCGNCGWVSFLFYFLGVIIALVTAIVINNLNEKRQYPTYWELGNFPCCPAAEVVELKPVTTTSIV